MSGPNYPYTKLDHEQVITNVFDESKDVLRILGTGGNLVPDQYNEIDLTYVVSGNGAGQIQTATYKKGGSTVATLTLSYDSQDRLTTVVRS